MRSDEDTKAVVIQMWNNGYSSGTISKEMMFTRSQVMGIVHRAKKAGLVSRDVVATPKPATPNRVVLPDSIVPRFGKTSSMLKTGPTPGKPEPILPKDPNHRGPRNILNIKDRECRWVVSPELFCARPSGKEHRSWCTDHYHIVYVKSERREKNAYSDVIKQKMSFNF
jgi:hypothetical protein